MKLNINRTSYELDVASDVPLLWVLRDHVGLGGTKFGCGIGQCGACTVHIDGQPARACLTTVGTVGNKHITTIEGADSSIARQVKKAWLELQVPQCGYCQSGQIMTAVALLESNSRPDDKDINEAMSGNICRCGTYPKIRRAIHQAAGQTQGSAD